MGLIGPGRLTHLSHDRRDIVYPFKTAYSGDGDLKDSAHGQDSTI